MKKGIVFSITFVLMLWLLISSPVFLFAQENCSTNNQGEVFCFLANLPGVEAPQGNDFGPYVNGIVRLIIGSAGVLAIIVIIIGGLQYMTTDAISGKQEGREKIWRAILGLIMVMASWLILFTINPDLISTSLNVERANLPAATPNGVDGPITSTTSYYCYATVGQCNTVEAVITGIYGCNVVSSCNQYDDEPPPDPPGPGGVANWNPGYWCFAYESPQGGCPGGIPDPDDP